MTDVRVSVVVNDDKLNTGEDGIIYFLCVNSRLRVRNMGKRREGRRSEGENETGGEDWGEKRR